MSKRVILSDEACKVLTAQRRRAKESLSSVILRYVPRPVWTFGDLEKHPDNVEAQLNVDWEALERVRERKRKCNHT